jgi:hypothetical protein
LLFWFLFLCGSLCPPMNNVYSKVVLAGFRQPG